MEEQTFEELCRSVLMGSTKLNEVPEDLRETVRQRVRELQAQTAVGEDEVAGGEW